MRNYPAFLMLELLISLFILSFSLLTIAGLHLYIIKQKGQIERRIKFQDRPISDVSSSSFSCAKADLEKKGVFFENFDIKKALAN